MNENVVQSHFMCVNKIAFNEFDGKLMTIMFLLTNILVIFA